jgi:hypothetical protein
MRTLKRLLLVFSCTTIGTCLGLAQAPGWVVIPVNEYSALRAKAYPAELAPEPAPVAATLTRVDYQLRLDGALAVGQANLTIDILQDGWVRVPIPAGLLVREARIGDKLVALVPSKGQSGIAALLSGKGRTVLRLDLVFPVTAAGGEQRLTLPNSGSGVTRAVISRELDPRDVEVTINSGYLAEKSPTRWLAYSRPNEQLTFIWKKKSEERKVELPLRLRGAINQLFGLGEDVTSLNAEVDIEVLQGSAHQVRIAVPDNLTINQVPGATVAEWDVQGGELGSELVVTFLEPVEHSVKFTINGETKLPREGEISIPLLRLLEAERESGGVAVEVLGAGEIKEAKPQGLEPAEAAELGAAVASRQSPSLAAFRLRPNATARSLDMTVVRYTQQALLTAMIDEARYRVLMNGEGATLVQARYAVRNNQRNFARIALPPAAVVWSASLAGRPVRPGKADDGSLLIPLVKARAGEDAPLFAIEILYWIHDSEWSPKGRATLTLPVLDLPVSRTGLVLYSSPLYHVTAEPGAFRTQAYARPASAVFGGEPSPSPAGGPGGGGPGGARRLANGDDTDSLAAFGTTGFKGATTSSKIEPPSTNTAALQELVDVYNATPSARKTATVSPVGVSFPTIGPSLYFVCELTGEGKPAVLELNYQKDKKGGVK